MLPASDMLPLQDEAVSIEPQYDGVIMLSPEVVLFSDATPRPDGRKVYHVFQRNVGEAQRDESVHSEDFHSRREQLFSQAHENTLHNIQQVLAESGLVNQEWCENGAEAPTNASTPTEADGQSHSIQAQSQPCYEVQMHSSPCKLHQFEMVFPIEPHSSRLTRRLLKRLRRKGIGQVELEPENHRINVRTRKSANFILGVLRSIDPNVRLIETYRETLLEDSLEAENLEIMDGL
ncbi:uncharacterized protein LOC135211181 isoform X1 [Macrobrachium nipponense]|uniref:uncharacterized protein LOC135211181 isoform X1 n=1 Tax=Macrobrachium nipponense TaxID=159736 RepID=UPI0030C83F94